MKMKQITIDPYSSAVSPIDMYFNETYLSRGSAFFWEQDSKIFLVTNWHNFSGKNPFTRKHLSDTAAEPNRITFDVFRRGDLNQRKTLSMNLYEGDVPSWLEHPTHKSGVDVVCLEVKLSLANKLFPINTLATSQLALAVGNDVFVLGFPMGIDTHRLPVWKRASVATEPDIDVDNLPMFYVDTASARGMSGAPVVHRSNSGKMDDGSNMLAGGMMSRFVGVYSGRIAPAGKHEAHLGIVWKSEVVPEIVSGGCAGSVG